MNLHRIPVVAALVAVIVVGATACDGDDAGAPPTPAPTVTVTVTETAAPSPEASPTPAGAPAGGGCDTLAEIGASMAFVVVESPAVGAEVPSPFTVDGCSNVFEASHQWELLDSQGQVLDSGFGTATCGTGCVGTFSFQVAYEVDGVQVGTLRVFTTSARDGSIEHLNAIPLLLAP